MPKHMRILLERELESLKRELLTLGAQVEQHLHKAVQAIEERDEKLARDVIDGDREIDRREVAVEEEGLKILALHQPVAIDLRFIVAVVKINNDLERVGDLAVNIAERAIALRRTKTPSMTPQFSEFAGHAQAMLRGCLDALVTLDSDKARAVCAMDAEADALNRQIYDRILGAIREHPDDLEALILLLSGSRQLERIADHCTNIAEDVIYMVEGDIVRHRAGAAS